MDTQPTPKSPTSLLARGLKIGVCVSAILLMIAGCLAVSIIYNWHRHLFEFNRFTVTMMFICSISVIVNYFTIVTSYLTATKLLTGLPQPDIDLCPVRFLTLCELMLQGLFYVFIKTSILHEPNYKLTSLDKMVINFIFIYGTAIRGLVLLLMEKLDMEYNLVVFGKVEYLKIQPPQQRRMITTNGPVPIS